MSTVYTALSPSHENGSTPPTKRASSQKLNIFKVRRDTLDLLIPQVLTRKEAVEWIAKRHDISMVRANNLLKQFDVYFPLKPYPVKFADRPAISPERQAQLQKLSLDEEDLE